MNQKQPLALLTSNLDRHSATVAWQQLGIKRNVPRAIEVLQLANKSAVFRLWDVLFNGGAVIAKRCGGETAQIERTIYEDIFPRLPITALAYYGSVQEDHTFQWIFIEDAGNERFSPLIEEHRILAAQWLGRLHTSTVPTAASVRLPDRGPSHYLELMRTTRQTILRNLSNPVLKARDVAVLENIVLQCNLLESRWSEIQQCCAGVQPTLVHGDFRPKNVRIRVDSSGPGLFPIDWETAGWGIPAADLTPSRGSLAIQVNIDIYWSIVREFWPGLDIQVIRRLAQVGKIFRRLAYVNWESATLGFDLYEWLSKPMASMKVYQADLADGIRTILEGREISE